MIGGFAQCADVCAWRCGGGSVRLAWSAVVTPGMRAWDVTLMRYEKRPGGGVSRIEDLHFWGAEPRMATPARRDGVTA